MDDIKVIKGYDWSGGCYEWSSAQVGISKTGEYMIRAGSGCSCDWISSETWEPIRDFTQIGSITDGLSAENSDLALKADFIAFAQGLIGKRGDSEPNG